MVLFGTPVFNELPNGPQKKPGRNGGDFYVQACRYTVPIVTSPDGVAIIPTGISLSGNVSLSRDAQNKQYSLVASWAGGQQNAVIADGETKKQFKAHVHEALETWPGVVSLQERVAAEFNRPLVAAAGSTAAKIAGVSMAGFNLGGEAPTIAPIVPVVPAALAGPTLNKTPGIVGNKPAVPAK